MSWHCYQSIKWVKDWPASGTPMMHDVRSMVDAKPTQIEREGWAAGLPRRPIMLAPVDVLNAKEGQ